MTSNQIDIRSFATLIRNAIEKKNKGILDLYDTYAGEAEFGLKLIEKNLNLIPSDAEIIEIGAGAMILSSYLALKGYKVTALEPISNGFSHFRTMQDIVLEVSKGLGIEINILNIPGEELEEEDKFDFGFSINVMEHVDDYEHVLSNVVSCLKIGGIYRFICPNYAFPFETHFNLPIIINKSITKFVFRKRIQAFNFVEDSEGLWASLNWIKTSYVKKAIGHKIDAVAVFSTHALELLFLRSMHDNQFNKRRPKLLNWMIQRYLDLNGLKLIKFIPENFQPTIDCTITKLK